MNSRYWSNREVQAQWLIFIIFSNKELSKVNKWTICQCESRQCAIFILSRLYEHFHCVILCDLPSKTKNIRRQTNQSVEEEEEEVRPPLSPTGVWAPANLQQPGVHLCPQSVPAKPSPDCLMLIFKLNLFQYTEHRSAACNNVRVQNSAKCLLV